ncbi:MAG TPA: hypothetical protein VH877_00440 [Polyangia bacterium]|jgi:hypothetical protein|nr:hypothetical protein [Polyangia bacterium]
MKKTPRTQKPLTKTPTPQTQAPAPESTYALGVLRERIGPPAPAIRDRMLTGMTDADLVALGADIASSRIVTDTTRIYNIVYDYWQRATPAQRRRLRGFTLPKLAVAVEQAHLLEQMQGRKRTKKSSDGTTRATLAAAFETARTSGMALRDQAASALQDIASLNPVLRQEVTTSVGTADTPDALALGLSNLAKVLRRWLASGDEVLTARLEAAALDEEYAAELAQAGQEILTAGTAARLRPTDTEQGNLDRLDGINLMLLGEIVRAFEHAHNIDPTIPRPTFIATRRIFNRPGKKKPTESTPAEPPAGADGPAKTPSA